MKKKTVFIDTLSAATTQAVTLATITNPTTSILGVTAVALTAGLGKQLLQRRQLDLEQLANDLSQTKTARAIKKMDEQQFFDDLTYSLEKILLQRTHPKRIIMRSVLLGYISSDLKPSYPLERMLGVVENLTFADIDYFRRILEANELRDESKIPWVSEQIMINHDIPKKDQRVMMVLTSSENRQDQQSKLNLVNEGLLVERNRGVGGWSAGEGTPQIYTTPFGQYFKEYLLDSNLDKEFS